MSGLVEIERCRGTAEQLLLWTLPRDDIGEVDDGVPRRVERLQLLSRGLGVRRLPVEERIEVGVDVQLRRGWPLRAAARWTTGVTKQARQHAARRRTVERNERRFELVAQARQIPAALGRTLFDEREEHGRNASAGRHQEVCEDVHHGARGFRAARAVGRRPYVHRPILADAHVVRRDDGRTLA